MWCDMEDLGARSDHTLIMLGPNVVKPEASPGKGQSRSYSTFVIRSRPSAAELSRIQEDVRETVDLEDLRGSSRT